MKTLVFGYGSLISLDSIRATAPGVSSLRPVYIKGFRRDFSLHDPEGYTVTNQDLAGIPFCSLDVQPCDDPAARVNGVVFAVSNEHDLQALLHREQEYKTPKAAVYDFETDEPLGSGIVFSSGKNNGKYDSRNPAQVRYLENCLAGAKYFGEKFYEEFTRTTYIGKKSLAEIPNLIM